MSYATKSHIVGGIQPMINKIEEISGIGDGPYESMVGILQYGRVGHGYDISIPVPLDMTQNYATVSSQAASISAFDYKGDHTRTDQAIFRALIELLSKGRPGIRKLIVLCTDGATYPQKHRPYTLYYAELAKSRYNIPIFVCEVPNDYGEFATASNEDMKGEISAIVHPYPDRHYSGGETLETIVTELFTYDGGNYPNLGFSRSCPPNICPYGYTFLSYDCTTCGLTTGCVKVYDTVDMQRNWEGAEAFCNDEGAKLFRWTNLNCYNALNLHLRSFGYTNSMLFWSCGTTPYPPYQFTCGGGNNPCIETTTEPDLEGNGKKDNCVILHHKSNQDTVPLPQPCNAQKFIICQRGFI
ncbi:unnamed protein product [Owenia fusiformis]|uniref:Uncharacterized protein n=1 Tax=Owenia fusiformis TaxID=6347 RepID=A0A8J1XII6_OWEFU|nr:unnamed protein product [Owenia fusiformis]